MTTNLKILLTDLQGLVKHLRTDLLERAIEVPEIDHGLREAYAATRQGHRTAQAFEVWRDDYLTQVAVAWVLACVFVRYLEDNALIDESWPIMSSRMASLLACRRGMSGELGGV